MLSEGTAATVEFRFADAVPATLARDGKKLGGQVVAISMLWRSTLFVTNFPRDTDDAAMRQMFGQVGCRSCHRLKPVRHNSWRHSLAQPQIRRQQAILLHHHGLSRASVRSSLSDPRRPHRNPSCSTG